MLTRVQKCFVGGVVGAYGVGGVATFFGKTDVGVFWVCISLWMMTFYRLVMGMAKESVRRDDADDAFERFMRIRNELDANEGRPDLIN